MLVKLFKTERDSARMLDVMGVIDSTAQCFGCTSTWSLFEVARALKKDGKPSELIELDLRELRRHKIFFIDVSRAILRKSERIIAAKNVYASDALHAATFQYISKKKSLEGMLSDDKHYDRLKDLVKVLTLNEIDSDSDFS